MIKITAPPLLSNFTHSLKPLAKHHYFIVTIVLFSAVAFAIYSVNQTLNIATDSDYALQQSQSTIGSKFNKSAKDTIATIKALQRSTDTARPDAPFPAGRINPFAE